MTTTTTSPTQTPPPGPAAAPAGAGLSGKQRRHLRGLGHHLDPVVLVGKEGVSEGLLGALEQALLEHELIKVRFLESVEGDRHDLAQALSRQSGAALIQVLGRTALYYKRRPDDDPRPHIPLS